jgi:polar amino acid transport system substrate-binding protein
MAKPTLLAAAVLCVAAAQAQTLHFTTEVSVPSAYIKDGKIVGYATDKLREALKRAGVQADFELLPWTRSFAMARTAPDTCVYPTGRTPEREAMFHWIGPVAHTDWWLFGLATRDFKIRTLRDARGLRIGSYNGDVRGEFLKSRGFLVDMAQSDEVNPQKLMLHRIDLWVTGAIAAQRRLEESGLTDEVAPVLMFNSMELYLACNPRTPKAVLAQLQAAFDSMERDGTLQRIEQEYGVEPPRNPRKK